MSHKRWLSGTRASLKSAKKLSMSHRDWTREELIVAFNLYRTPSAVSWKLANFARLDPVLRKRSIVGASHGGRGEVEIWNEFNNNWDRLAYESEQLLEKMTRHLTEVTPETEHFPVGKNRATLIQARVNQGFFRAAVLAAYDLRCCVTGLAIPQLLVASHIVPWSSDTRNRTNPRNGLCLNAIHDRAFDCGLLTITPDLRVKLSERIKRKSHDIAAKDFLLRYEGAPVTLPRRFVPDEGFLRYHNENIFLSTR
jgi:putative restriction endonuclease